MADNFEQDYNVMAWRCEEMDREVKHLLGVVEQLAEALEACLYAADRGVILGLCATKTAREALSAAKELRK